MFLTFAKIVLLRKIISFSFKDKRKQDRIRQCICLYFWEETLHVIFKCLEDSVSNFHLHVEVYLMKIAKSKFTQITFSAN